MSPDQDGLLEPYARRYFDVLAEVWRDWKSDMAQYFASNAYPVTAISEQTIRATDDYIDRTSPPPPLRRLLIENRDDVARALRCQARDRQAGRDRPVPDRADRGRHQRIGGQLLGQHGPAVGTAQRDPPVRVLGAGARQVLRPALPHRLGQRHADQRGRGPGQVAVQADGELVRAHG